MSALSVHPDIPKEFAMLATFARISHHIDRQPPDPRTATCEKHIVASPYSDTARGGGVAISQSAGWECVVCPLPDSDLIGEQVIAIGHGPTSVFVYGGPEGDRPSGMLSISFSLLRAGDPVIKADVSDVAPLGTPWDIKDPRITVTKLPKKRDYQDSGPWLPAIDHDVLRDLNPRAKKTKRDAVEWAAIRLAIADFHEKRNATKITA